MRSTVAVAALTAATGLALSLYGTTVSGHIQPPVPRPALAIATSETTAEAPPARPTRGLPRSPPARISVPALGISSGLGPGRGLAADGTLDDAPLLGPLWALPWWYNDGPAPGQNGSAVILGHVDSALGSGHLGVFFRLGALRPGQSITVTLTDRTVTRWTVVSTDLYTNASFPNTVVYDRSGAPTLRLVTCGGRFNWHTHEYESATVVTARPAV